MRGQLFAMAVAFALSACGSQSSGLGTDMPSIDAAALRAAASDDLTRRFYAARGWRPAWSEDRTAALTQAIGEASGHGLDPGQWLDPIRSAPNPAAREAAMTRAALDYATALARGRLDPTELRDPYSVPRPDFDAPAALSAALDGGDIGGWLAGLAPQDAEYRAMSEAYLATRQSTARAAIPAGEDIRPGAADPRIGAIAAALAADGYVQHPQGQPPPDRYDPALVAAVRRLQTDYGLEPDGIIDADALDAINEGAAGRARALAVNLERRRWLARQAPATRIDVNTAAATLTFWQDGEAADRRRAIVGQPGNETPELGSPIYRLVANPTWTVPRSIQNEEIAQRGAGYMARNNMEWRDGWIVQRSGPTNALGLVKFDMQNPHAIYLHDTPAKALFDRDDRHASHGCVRVQDALGFAALIAERQGVREEWERARATGEETFVRLARPIPVRMIYHSAFLDGGRVQYRLDVYGWDEAVARRLGFPARQARTAARRHRSDTGP
ncbi:MAG: L,D-transpeptidase family protein [Sphingomonas sp.]